MSIKRKLMNIIISCLPIELNKKEINIYECGDYYSTDVALVLANKMNIKPDEIVFDIKNKIRDELIDNVEVIDSIYINIYLNKEYLFNNLYEIIKEGKNYGKINYGSGKKINIDYGIINVDDLLDIDFIRRIIYCDSLSNILSFCGYDVVRDFFARDYNKEVFDVKNIKIIMDRFRIGFASINRETDLINQGMIDSIISELQKSSNCLIDEYSLFIKLQESSLQIIDKDGNYDKLLFDIVYYASKLDKNYDRVYSIFNPEYMDYIDKVMSCLQVIGYDVKSFVNGQVECVNKDNNDLQLISDINTIRYGLLEDINKKIESISSDNINYLEKSYSKIFSILRKKQYGNNDKKDTIDNKCAYTIMNKLMEFEDIVIIAAENYNPCIVKKYICELSDLITDLCSEFEKGIYFDKYDILLRTTAIVMDNASNLLGLILREDF